MAWRKNWRRLETFVQPISRRCPNRLFPNWLMMISFGIFRELNFKNCIEIRLPKNKQNAINFALSKSKRFQSFSQLLKEIEFVGFLLLSAQWFNEAYLQQDGDVKR